MDAAIKELGLMDQLTQSTQQQDHTLKNRLSGRVVDGTKPGYFNSLEEKKLEEYLIQANKVWYGKTRCQVKIIAEKVAIDNGVLQSARISNGW